MGHHTEVLLWLEHVGTGVEPTMVAAHRFALHQLLQLLAVGLSVEGTRRALLQVVLSKAQWCSPAMRFPTFHLSNSSRGLRNS